MAAPPPPAAKAKGSGLTRKVGPFPLFVWAIGGLIIGYVLYKHLAGSSGSSGAAQQTQTVASQTPDQSMGLAPQPGASSGAGDTGQSTSDYISALGAQNQSLISALSASASDVAGLASSQIAYAQTQTSLGSFSTQTQPTVAMQPGGSYAPQFGYVMPQMVTTPNAKPPAKTTTHAVQTAPAPKYFTYKRDVPLGRNQTVHFSSGLGYYAH